GRQRERRVGDVLWLDEAQQVRLCQLVERRVAGHQLFLPQGARKPTVWDWRKSAFREQRRKKDAQPSSVLDRQAPHVLVAEGGFLLVGTTDLCAWTAEGACNRLPITVAFLVTGSPLVVALQETGLIRAQMNSYMVILSVRGTTE